MGDIYKLIEQLNYYTEMYDKGTPVISDKEYDKLYYQLEDEEEKSGIIYNNSPTHSIHYSKIDKLKEIKHEHLMLSLDKSQDLQDIKNFLKELEFVAMFKLDGLSCSLTYENKHLVRAETRGNGIVGEDILHNARIISNIPSTIPYDKRIVVDGEIICQKDTFLEFETEYKNPRNFAAGSIRLLDAAECKKRKLTFVAWEMIEGPSVLAFSDKLDRLDGLGFTTVPRIVSSNVEQAVRILESVPQHKIYPSDGYVFKFNDVIYGKLQGRTEHHFKDAIAYKLYDDEYQSRVVDIEWTMGRTGQLTPVLIYEELEIEGNTYTRANLHNVSILKKLLGKPYKGQQVFIYRANQIIPQVRSAQTNNPDNVPTIEIIKKCPFCGADTYISKENESEVLYCSNFNCLSRVISRVDYFASKDGLNIKGLSTATIEKLFEWGWINKATDLFYLFKHRKEWIRKPSFGPASVDKILASIEEKRNTTLEAFITALGIPLIGKHVAKKIAKHFKTYEDFREAVSDKNYNFSILENFGEEKNKSLKTFNYEEADKIVKFLNFAQNSDSSLSDKLVNTVICITGRLKNFKNREALSKLIEEYGGKVTTTVSKKTTILINNDIESNSEKNTKAKSYGIPILTEEEFLVQYNIAY